MDLLRKELEKLRFQNRNSDGRYFASHEKTRNLMTEKKIRAALEDISTAKHSIDEITEVILGKACNTFAILTLIGEPQKISLFIKEDGHAVSHIDDKLPFMADSLQEILKDQLVISRFLEKQWEFAVPIFDRSALPRHFKDQVTLPFLEEIHIGSGGFGNVYKVRISPSHQRYDQNTDWFVRKEFRPDCTDNDVERELHTLALLRLLHHPNLVELIGVYTYKGMHNFLFPLAEHGNMTDLLRNDKPPQLHSNRALLIALAGLGFAVRAVHEYSAADLRAIGIHHDIKPSNILVNKSSFVLADFGLSRLKEPPQSSATMSKDARGDYLAPECEDLEADCEKRVIHRSSDIWSLGCVLAELLTYMIQGPDGVKQFEAERVFVIRGLKLWRFHCGPGKQSKAVVDWMRNIKNKCQGPEYQLALLIEEMLSIAPEDRLRGPLMSEMLCNIAVAAATQPVDDLFRLLLESSQSVQLFVQQKRWASWKLACRLEEWHHQPPSSNFLWNSQDTFNAVLSHLEDLHRVLKLVTSNHKASPSLLSLQLQKQCDGLLASLPQGLHDEARTLFEQDLLEKATGVQLEQVMSGVAGEDARQRVGALAAIKYMGILTQQQLDCEGSAFDPNLLRDRKDQESYATFAKVDNSTTAVPVMVETKRVDMHGGDQIAQQLLSRLSSLTNLINSAGQQEALHVLHCRGAFYTKSDSTFSLVYDFPRPSSVQPKTSKPKVTTLLSILEQTSKTDNREILLPLLGARFRLAHELAVSLLNFHTVGWMHKCLSSSVIMLFYYQIQEHARDPSSADTRLQNWYLRGFLHSRLNDEVARSDERHSDGLTSDLAMMDYLHPRYLRGLNVGTWRYKAQYDYYSLGIVLLEIGLWKSLREMTAKWKGYTPEQLRDKLLGSVVPLLGPRMGILYRDAVYACLKAEFAGVQDDNSTDMRLAFRASVVNQLAQCKA